MLIAAKEEEHAFGLLQNVKQNFEILCRASSLSSLARTAAFWTVAE